MDKRERKYLVYMCTHKHVHSRVKLNNESVEDELINKICLCFEEIHDLKNMNTNKLILCNF